MKIKNRFYRKFLDEGIIVTIKETDMLRALDNVKGIRGKYVDEGRALLILLYYTGCRPNEALKVKAKDIEREKTYLKVKMQGSKGGYPRTIYIPYKHSMAKELFKYSSRVFDEMFLFFHYRSKYTRKVTTKSGEIKVRIDITDKLRYFFARWFKETEITPYVLRHNRLSKLAEKGATMEQLRQIKGAKSFDSVMPYLHLSKEQAQKVGRKID